MTNLTNEALAKERVTRAAVDRSPVDESLVYEIGKHVAESSRYKRGSDNHTRVWLAAQAGARIALRTTLSKDTGRDAVVRLANELRERSRFPSGVARISEAKAREIAESALSTPDPITPEHFAENANCPATPEPEIARAVEAEREACARVAEHYNFGPERTERDNARNAIAEIIARAIRARHDTEGAGQ